MGAWGRGASEKVNSYRYRGGELLVAFEKKREQRLGRGRKKYICSCKVVENCFVGNFSTGTILFCGNEVNKDLNVRDVISLKSA